MTTLLSGGEVFQDAPGEFLPLDLLIEGERIAALVPRGELNKHWEGELDSVIDVKGMQIFPGLIDAHSHMGTWVSRPLGNDSNECSAPITPGVRAVDGINPADPDMRKSLSCGLTTMMLPPGSGNLLGGQAALIQPYGATAKEMTLHPYKALKAALGENPISVYGPEGKSPASRMGNARVLEETLEEAYQYWRGREQRVPEERKPFWEIFMPVFNGEIPLKIHCHRADDILTAIRLTEPYPIRITLDHCTEGYLIADVLAEKQIPLLTGPLFMFKTKEELRNKSVMNPLVLTEKGCSVSLISDHPFANGLYLGPQAGLLHKGGMSWKDALYTIARNPARALEIDSERGSLDIGKIADIAVFDGSPLEMRSRCRHTFLGGKLVYTEDKGKIQCC